MLKALLALVAVGIGLSGTPAGAGSPPARYSYEPKMPVKVMRVSDVTRPCRNPFQRYGCQFFREGVCYIVIARRLPRGWYKGILKHEKAHCNGWPGHHPR